MNTYATFNQRRRAASATNAAREADNIIDDPVAYLKGLWNEYWHLIVIGLVFNFLFTQPYTAAPKSVALTPEKVANVSEVFEHIRGNWPRLALLDDKVKDGHRYTVEPMTHVLRDVDVMATKKDIEIFGSVVEKLSGIIKEYNTQAVLASMASNSYIHPEASRKRVSGQDLVNHVKLLKHEAKTVLDGSSAGLVMLTKIRTAAAVMRKTERIIERDLGYAKARENRLEQLAWNLEGIGRISNKALGDLMLLEHQLRH